MSKYHEEKEPERVRFQFIKADDYRLIYVNGVYGGITPRGELICLFFLEYVDMLVEEVGSLKDGKLQTDKIRKIYRVKHKSGEIVVRRDLKVGLIIPIHQISSIANWMLDKLKSSNITIETKEKE